MSQLERLFTFGNVPGLVFCKTCYAKHIGPKGFGYGGTCPVLMCETDGDDKNFQLEDDIEPAPSKNSGNSGQPVKGSFGPRCPKCSKAVFPLERVFVGKEHWHR